ncbi:MAG: efflux RND transporter permease subunit, partial [Verrucomicrobiales bacterium]|nr:efflux RND transporter permease subunit [Verrucomicrobiales bacterium]
ALSQIKQALLGDGSLWGTFSSSLFLAFLVIYLVLVVLFQSWSYPIVIMLTVPLATFGGFLGLSAVHYWSVVDPYMPVQNLDMLSILGFVILAGVVVNNAILIIHQTLNMLKRGGGGLTADEAIAESVRSRVRPILMSSLTSVGGMLPLVLLPGAGSELYRGLGAVVVGGLLLATVFTLVLVPCVLSLVFGLVKREEEVGA